MSLTLPTTKEISDQIIFYIEGILGQSIPILPKAVFRVLANAFAATFIMLYKFIGWQLEQAFVETAGEAALVRWGDLVDIPRNLGQPAILPLNILGQVGETILAGTRFNNNATGVNYLLDGDVLIGGGGIGSGTITALTVGENGNMEIGEPINFVTPLPNINKVATITGTVQIGIGVENLELYRVRVSNRYKKKPQGGAYADYQAWALEVPTIDGAFPYSGDLEGTVWVFIRSLITPDGVPTSNEIMQVLDSINEPDRRPVTANVFVFSILNIKFNVTIFNLTPDTPDLRDLIEASLNEYFKSREPYIQGLSIQNNGTITVAEVISVIQSVVDVNGASFDNATMQLESDPMNDIPRYVLGEGQVALLDGVAYV